MTRFLMQNLDLEPPLLKQKAEKAWNTEKDSEKTVSTYQVLFARCHCTAMEKVQVFEPSFHVGLFIGSGKDVVKLPRRAHLHVDYELEAFFGRFAEAYEVSSVQT